LKRNQIGNNINTQTTSKAEKMKNLQELLLEYRFNQTALAKYLGITRGTLRSILNKDMDIIVKDGKVYKQIGKARDE